MPCILFRLIFVATMPRILFIAAHRPNRSPSQRYRFEQYFEYFREKGYTCDLSWLLSDKDDKGLYNPGVNGHKLYIFLKSVFIRSRDTFRASSYDIVFVQREAFMTGSVFFEKMMSRSSACFIYDFDDAIWHLDVSAANRKLSWLKKPEKTSELIEMADMVIAGNAYLANYAKQYNARVCTIPTTIDTCVFKPQKEKSPSEVICIGWSGSLTTIKHFEFAIPFLRKLKKKYGKRISFKVMGDETYVNEELDIQGIKWAPDREVSELASFDIGIMPLPDDEWVKGKCGLKGLSYMSLEVPTVMSDVGVNPEIIQDGKNGFLASSEEQWISKISFLIDSPELRLKMGKAGRETVVERYSVLSQRDEYIRIFDTLLAEKAEK
jgi:glycosyltransferase involved in cell wall biosynthesis